MTKKNDGYKYRYYTHGNVVWCEDNCGCDEVEAICRTTETAEAFVNILNQSRASEQIFGGCL